jgi:hypothetical protein
MGALLYLGEDQGQRCGERQAKLPVMPEAELIDYRLPIGERPDPRDGGQWHTVFIPAAETNLIQGGDRRGKLPHHGVWHMFAHVVVPQTSDHRLKLGIEEGKSHYREQDGEQLYSSHQNRCRPITTVSARYRWTFPRRAATTPQAPSSCSDVLSFSAAISQPFAVALFLPGA